jgi:hypothetical protein
MKKQRQVPDFGFISYTRSGHCFYAEPGTWNNPWTLSEPWLMKRVYGEAGNAQYLAEQLKDFSMLCLQISQNPFRFLEGTKGWIDHSVQNPANQQIRS